MASRANLWMVSGFFWARDEPRGAPGFFVSTLVEMKTRSPHTIGEEDPAPGMGTFHRRFWLSLH
jgi:hypothetical protein